MNDQTCEFYCYRKTRPKENFDIKKMDKLELVAFDMDGVLTDILSSWKYIHDYFKTSNEKSVDLYVRGKIDDKEFIRRDAELWKINGKPLKKNQLEKILNEIPIMKGAKTLIDFLKRNQIKTAIVSAGIDILANRIGKELGIDLIYANGIQTDDQGYLNGNGIVGVKLRFKDETIEKICKENNISMNKIATIGNSCFDIPMFKTSGLSIAFNPDDKCVCEYADFSIEKKDLEYVVPILKKYIKK